MDVFEKFYIGVQPSFGKVTEDQAVPMWFFNWFLISEDQNNPNLSLNRRRILWLQAFAAQYCTQLINDMSGMDHNYHGADPNVKLTKRQRESITKGLGKLYWNAIERFNNDDKILIQKPLKPNL